MLKTILVNALTDIKQREERKQSLMADCVDNKLDRSLKQYEDNLRKTCEYILMKNPISVIKRINKDFQEE